MIPQIIHFAWLSNNEYPILVQKCIDSLLHYHTLDNWLLCRWTPETVEKSCSKFIGADILQNPDIPYIIKTDLLRWNLLYFHGGIWIDTDVLFCASLKPLTLNNCFFTAWSGPGTIGNAIVGADRNHPLCARIAEEIVHAFQYIPDEVLKSPEKYGVDLASTLMKQARDDITIYHRNYFYPADWFDSMERKLKSAVKGFYATHLYLGNEPGGWAYENRLIHPKIKDVTETNRMIKDSIERLESFLFEHKNITGQA